MRLTQLRRDVYRMVMANHHGQWEPVLFTGTLMLTMLVEQFGFALVK